MSTKHKVQLNSSALVNKAKLASKAIHQLIIYHPEHSAKINNMSKHQTKQDLQISPHKTNEECKKKSPLNYTETNHRATGDNNYPGELKTFMDSLHLGQRRFKLQNESQSQSQFIIKPTQSV